MMVVPFKPEHIKTFRNFGGQNDRVIEVSETDVEVLATPDAFTAVRDDGSPIGCAGVIRAHDYRATAWGLFQKTTHAEFLFVHRSTKAFLMNTRYVRIEAYVDPGFYPAVRWIKLLGFELERAYIPFFFPNGTGASAWALHK